jgi:hypothetical protein
VPARRAYSDDEVEAAIALVSDPQRLEAAQRLVAQNAPQLQRIFNEALDSADWFGSVHQAELARAADAPDPDERVQAFRTLVAEETRLSMLVGVAVGFELGHVLMESTEED